ncbi:MAG: sulfatase [Candidatus Hinthialibacter antarcticus]|nr:sulfatase [Candidatus Hinthialibacter antarcticus]
MPLTRRSFLQSSMALAAMRNAVAQTSDSDEKPNIIWIIADDVGGRDIACYGHPTIRTPTIDALAKGGLQFTNAFVTISSCSPSRCSVFTGKYPHSTGADNLHDPLPANQAIVPELLAPAGYHTGSVGKLHLGDAAAKKFHSVKGKVTDWSSFMDERPKQQPFFLQMGFVDAHRPFDRGCIDKPYTHEEIVVPRYLPDIPIVRENLAGFYDEITRMDQEIGKLMDHLRENNLLENTLIIFWGDNGMPFPRAKTTMYDSGISTPLIAFWPRMIQPQQKYDGLVSTVDIAPATLQAAGVEVPSDMQGVSLTDQVMNPSEHERDYIFAEANWHDFDEHIRAVRDKRYKYIHNAFPERALETSADSLNTPMFEEIRKLRDANQLTQEQMLLFRSRRAEEELYDITADPNEFYNLAYDPAYQKVLVRMRKRLDQWIQETNDIPPDDSLPNEFHPETGKRIKAEHQNK